MNAIIEKAIDSYHKETALATVELPATNRPKLDTRMLLEEAHEILANSMKYHNCYYGQLLQKTFVIDFSR